MTPSFVTAKLPAWDLPAFNVPYLGGESAKDKTELVHELHGLHLIVGPTGSGKTLLACHLARSYLGKVCHLCPPGTECHKRGGTAWRIIANMRHPTVLKWADYLDDLDQLDRDGGHVIGIIDEIHQFADARRSMAAANLVISRLLAQSRKSTVKLFVTSQSVGKVDVRLRNEAKVFWNVWNPDQQGLTLGAVIQKQSDGALPPWRRARPRPVVRFFNTRGTRNHYATLEVIDDAPLTRGAKAQDSPRMYADYSKGAFRSVDMDTLILSYVNDEINKRMADPDKTRSGYTLRPERTARQMSNRKHIDPPLVAADIRRVLEGRGWRYSDSKAGFWVPRDGYEPKKRKRKAAPVSSDVA